VSTLTPSKEHFVEGKKFYFRVTILQATGIPRDFTNVFVQFKYALYPASFLNCISNKVLMSRFLNGANEAFSTEPLKNENQDLALGFYHMKNVCEAYIYKYMYMYFSI
jgi:kinesin family protein 1